MRSESYWTRLQLQRISRRRFVGGAVAAAGLLSTGAAVGCGNDEKASDGARAGGSPEAPKSGGELKSFLAADPPNFHALNEIGVSVDAITSLVYNTLVRVSPGTGVVEPDLAEKWEVSPDGLTYVFHLAPAKWHDGSPVSSQDVKASYEYYLAKPPGLNTRKTSFLANVTQVNAVDNGTVQIKLDSPRASFLASIGIGYMQIAPKAQIDAGPAFFQTKTNGSGPFKFASFTPGAEVKLVKNAAYFKPSRPYLDAISLGIVKEPSTRLALMRGRQVDMSWTSTTLTPPDVRELKTSNSDWSIETVPSAGFVAAFINMTKPPLTDVRLRRAITLTVDRDAAVQVLEQGQGTIGGYISPGPFAFSPEQVRSRPGYRKPKDQDIAEAKRLLSQAGYGSGLKIPAIYATDLGPLNEPAALFSKDQLAKAGIELDLKPMLYADINKLRASKDWQIWVNGTAREAQDPFFAAAHLDKDNLFGLADQKAFDLFDRQAVTIDEQKRKAAVRELEEYLFDIVPYAPFYFRVSTTASGPQVKGFVADGSGHLFVPQFDNVWLSR